jgi:hypothetical protein
MLLMLLEAGGASNLFKGIVFTLQDFLEKLNLRFIGRNTFVFG